MRKTTYWDRKFQCQACQYCKKWGPFCRRGWKGCLNWWHAGHNPHVVGSAAGQKILGKVYSPGKRSNFVSRSVVMPLEHPHWKKSKPTRRNDREKKVKRR